MLCSTAWAQVPEAYGKANIAFQSGDFGSAAKLLEQAEADSPGKTDALLLLGKCFVHLQRFPEAEQAVRRFLDSHAGSADALYLLGYILHRENKPADSLAVYTKAANITVPTSDDLKIVALDYVLLKDYTDAIHWLERSVAMDPQNKEAWYYLGRAYLNDSRPQRAREAFLKLLTLEPHHARAENNLGLIFESEGNNDAAMDAYRKAIEWQEEGSRSSEQPYLNLGTLLMNLGRLEEALPLLSKTVEIAPRDAQCQTRLGVTLLRMGKLPEAGKHLEEAVRLDPEDAQAHYQLGRYYRQVNNLPAAKVEFDRVAVIQGRASEPGKPRPKTATSPLPNSNP